MKMRTEIFDSCPVFSGVQAIAGVVDLEEIS